LSSNGTAFYRATTAATAMKALRSTTVLTTTIHMNNNNNNNNNKVTDGSQVFSLVCKWNEFLFFDLVRVKSNATSGGV
jgi:hypothetical protein